LGKDEKKVRDSVLEALSIGGRGGWVFCNCNGKRATSCVVRAWAHFAGRRAGFAVSEVCGCSVSWNVSANITLLSTW